jgi:hypothetical protein
MYRDLGRLTSAELLFRWRATSKFGVPGFEPGARHKRIKTFGKSHDVPPLAKVNTLWHVLLHTIYKSALFLSGVKL